jgi:hypothetical protein
MARNNPKPTGKVDWDATGNIVEPNAGRKTSGWLFDVKPPAQNFNWFWWLVGKLGIYYSAQVEDWIVIDSDADEGDYAALADYIADAPAVGDRVLVKEDQTVTVQTIIPDGITIKFLDGARILSATDTATSVLKLGTDIVIEGELNVILSQTGTIAKAVEFDGANTIGNIKVRNGSTGTLTTGYHINANNTGNRILGLAQNTGGGVFTNIIVDNSTELSNSLIIVDQPNKIVIATGVVDFASPQKMENKTVVDASFKIQDEVNTTSFAEFQTGSITIGATRVFSFPDGDGKFVLEALTQTLTDKSLGTGTKIALGSDADGDIYYRDAGILKRLAKGVNDTYLRLVGGIPSWSDTGVFSGGIQTDGVNTFKTKLIDIGTWDMNATDGVRVAHGLTRSKIRTFRAMIKGDDDAESYLPLDYDLGSGAAGNILIDPAFLTEFSLNRKIGGSFDNTSFDKTTGSYNRGYIEVTYVP